MVATQSQGFRFLLYLVRYIPILDSLDSKIGAKFSLNRKIFRDYSETIHKIGREGEKRVHEALLEEYLEHPEIIPIWENAERESGKHYDILLSNSAGIDKYIEVKTTHTDQKSFEMSEEEFKFAMENSNNYKLYLLINFGSGPDSYKVIIENFKEIFGKDLRGFCG